jgi:hypothetical protein
MAENVCTSIIDHFATLPDPRILLKTRHKLVDIVAMALCAVVAGADDWVEIAAYAKAKDAWFRDFLELPGGIPSHDTFGRVFALLDSDAFGKCYVDWIRALINMPDDLVAIDGKTLRRSHDRSNDKSAIHMVNAWAVHHGLVLGQVKTEAKSNEITAIPELLRASGSEGLSGDCRCYGLPERDRQANRCPRGRLRFLSQRQSRKSPQRGRASFSRCQEERLQGSAP